MIRSGAEAFLWVVASVLGLGLSCQTIRVIQGGFELARFASSLGHGWYLVRLGDHAVLFTVMVSLWFTLAYGVRVTWRWTPLSCGLLGAPVAAMDSAALVHALQHSPSDAVAAGDTWAWGYAVAGVVLLSGTLLCCLVHLRAALARREAASTMGGPAAGLSMWLLAAAYAVLAGHELASHIVNEGTAPLACAPERQTMVNAAMPAVVAPFLWVVRNVQSRLRPPSSGACIAFACAAAFLAVLMVSPVWSPADTAQRVAVWHVGEVLGALVYLTASCLAVLAVVRSWTGTRGRGPR